MKKLAWVTVGLTYFLICWRNIVSETGSGLVASDGALKWGHWLIPFVTGLFIVATVVSVFKFPNENPFKKLRKSLLLFLVLHQVSLTAVALMLHLPAWVSSIHLVSWILVFSVVIAIGCVTQWGDPTVKPDSPKIRRLAVAGLGALFFQLFLGGLIRHHNSGLACPLFPGCLDGFLPLPLSFETALAFTHRWLGVLMLGLFAHLAFAAPKLSPKLTTPARQLLSLGIAQVLLGIGTVLSGLHAHTRALHTIVGYALWGILFYIGLRSGGLRWLWEANNPLNSTEKRA